MYTNELFVCFGSPCRMIWIISTFTAVLLYNRNSFRPTPMNLSGRPRQHVFTLHDPDIPWHLQCVVALEMTTCEHVKEDKWSRPYIIASLPNVIPTISRITLRVPIVSSFRYTRGEPYLKKGEADRPGIYDLRGRMLRYNTNTNVWFKRDLFHTDLLWVRIITKCILLLKFELYAIV